MAKLPVDYRRKAHKELRKIYRDLEKARPGHGELFLQDVDKAIEQILAFPQAFRMATPDVRLCRLSKFKNYALYYQLEPQRLLIYAVFHGHQDPQELNGRLK